MYLLYKNAGETCLECLNRLKTALREGSKPVPESLTYAGRLDPLASGLLIALADEEIAQKDQFLGLDKTYDFEVVFGVSTDTFDQLGVVYPSDTVVAWKTLRFDKEILLPKVLEIAQPDQVSYAEGHKQDSMEVVSNELQRLVSDSIEMHYPFFSSKPVGGMPLFQYTKNHGVDATNLLLPVVTTGIKKIECIDIDEITASELMNETIAYAEKVNGQFRQKEIIESWKEWNGSNGATKDASLSVLKLRLTCTSGFYIRTFAMWLGQQTGKGAIARNIKRVAIGMHTIDQAMDVS